VSKIPWDFLCCPLVLWHKLENSKIFFAQTLDFSAFFLQCLRTAKRQRSAVISEGKNAKKQTRAKLKTSKYRKIKMFSEINIYQQCRCSCRMQLRAAAIVTFCMRLTQFELTMRRRANPSRNSQLHAQIVDTNDRVQMRSEKRNDSF